MINKVTLKVDGITLDGSFFLPESKPPHPVICLCHGIPSRKPEPDGNGYEQTAEDLCRLGFAAMIFNFRGTGASGGNLDITGWTRDLVTVIDYLHARPEVDRSRLCLLGFSGGAAVSVYVAAGDRRVSGVAACACPADFNLVTEAETPALVVDHFRSIGAIRDRDFPESTREWLDGFRMVRPVDLVVKITTRPLLLVQGDDDDTVPVDHAHRLYRQAGEPKKLVIIDGAGHRLRHDSRAMTAVTDWLKAWCQSS